MKDTRLLAVGTYPPPVHGESVVFKKVVEIIQDNVSTDIYNKHSYHDLILMLLSLTIRRYDIIYIGITRTLRGMLLDLFVMYLGSSKRTRVICHVHGNEWSQVKNSLLFKLYRKLIPKNVEFLFLSKYLKSVSGLENINSRIVPNYGTSRASLSLGNRRFPLVFGVLSGLHFSKGLFQILFGIGAKAKLTLAGPPRRDSVLSKTAVEDILRYAIDATGINYIGELHQEKQSEFWDNIDVFILPTFYRTEAQPLVILDALLSKKWLVLPHTDLMYSQFSAFPSVTWVDDYDLDSWSQAVDRVQKSFSPAKIQKSYSMAQESFSDFKFEENIKAIFNEI